MSANYFGDLNFVLASQYTKDLAHYLEIDFEAYRDSDTCVIDKFMRLKTVLLVAANEIAMMKVEACSKDNRILELKGRLEEQERESTHLTRELRRWKLKKLKKSERKGDFWKTCEIDVKENREMWIPDHVPLR